MNDSTGAPNTSRNRTLVRSVLHTAPVLFVFWIVLSGHVEPLFLSLGVASVLLVCVIAHRAGVLDADGVTFARVLRLPPYLLWLVKEVLVSAVDVVRKVWSPRPSLRPVVAKTPSTGLSELTQVVYANSITFTPGTLSFDVDDDCVNVHSLDEAGIEELRSGAMLRRVRRLEPRR